MMDIECSVLDNQEVARDTFLLSLSSNLPPSIPGQFVMVKINSGHEPFLRRPFAILADKDRKLEILYKIKGQGTLLLAQKSPGETLSVLGPLGNGFRTPLENESLIYIAGGTGLPPIMSLAEHLKRGVMVFGTRTKDDIPLLSRLSKIPGIELRTTTEDGSLGRKGMATDILNSYNPENPLIIYACGPKGMLRATSEYAKRTGARCEVSLEEYMSCGFGVCSGCVVETKKGNLRVCREGPVFDSSDLIWS
jgi:dihydroorotate dehydrogenase electron transfer subunit